MGNNYCIHCGTPRNYYTNMEHASRCSCRLSHDKYHDFKSESLIILSSVSNKIKNSVTDCLKKHKNKTNKTKYNYGHIEMTKL